MFGSGHGMFKIEQPEGTGPCRKNSNTGDSALASLIIHLHWNTYGKEKKGEQITPE
jgi:hypothetical protein